MKRNILNRPYVVFLIVAAVSIIAYANTLDVPFHFDDKQSIVDNPLVKDLSYFITPTEESIYTPSKTRFMGQLSFALNCAIHGLDVTGYHIVNLLIHIINAFLVYYIVLITFRTPKLTKSSLAESSGYIALFSGLLFASHPLQTQAVTYIVQRFASLAAMFCLFSLLMYIQARIKEQGAGVRKSFYILSLLSAAFAMKTKEMAFTLPVIAVLYEFLFFQGKTIKRVIYLIPLLLTMLIIPLSLLDMDAPLGEVISDVSEKTTVQTEMSRGEYLVTQFRVIVTYIRLLFLPLNQNLDYDYPLYHSLFNPEVFLSFIFLLMVIGAGAYLFYRYRDSVPHTRLITFGIFWFFITLSVESGIVPIVDVIFEHRVYLPSAGVFIIISTSLFMAAGKFRQNRKAAEKTVVIVLAIITIALTGATFARNMVWKDELSLWSDVVNKSPRKSRGYNNVGLYYKSQGLYDQAIKYFNTAISLNPNSYRAHNNLGNAYLAKGVIDKAMEEYNAVMKLNPGLSTTYFNLGVIYFRHFQDHEKAITYYSKAIKLNHRFSKAYSNRGLIYSKLGFNKKAMDDLNTAITLDNRDSISYFVRGITRRNSGNNEQSIADMKTAAQLDNKNAQQYLSSREINW